MSGPIGAAAGQARKLRARGLDVLLVASPGRRRADAADPGWSAQAHSSGAFPHATGAEMIAAVLAAARSRAAERITRRPAPQAAAGHSSGRSCNSTA